MGIEMRHCPAIRVALSLHGLFYSIKVPSSGAIAVVGMAPWHIYIRTALLKRNRPETEGYWGIFVLL
jgi:hypothetical protein